MVFGMMMLSLATTYYQIMLSQGFLVGIGQGLTYIPSLAIVGDYFEKKRPIAMAWSQSGIAIGGVIYPFIFSGLQPRIGFGWSTRIVAFVGLGAYLVAFLLLKPKFPKQQGKGRALIDSSAYREPPFTIFCIIAFFLLLGLYVPFFLLAQFARERVDTSLTFALHIPSILNGASLFGRIIPAYMTRYINPVSVFAGSILAVDIVIFSWIAVSSNVGVIMIAVFSGFSTGACLAMAPACTALLCPDKSKFGTRLGMAWFPAGVALLVSGPIAGATIRDGAHAFLGMQLWAASNVFLAFVLALLLVYYVQYRKYYLISER